MCLAIPGKIESITGAESPLDLKAKVNFGGILKEVSLAYVPEANKYFQTVITNNAKSLSKKEIRDAVKNIQKLKFYPRDDKENQRLLLYAERIVGEIDKFRREGLEMMIDRFEMGMASNDKEVFEATKDDLLMTLSELGMPFQ